MLPCSPNTTWRVRHSAYDAAYLELAKRLGAEIWTVDGPLARNAGSRYSVQLIAPAGDAESEPDS